MLLTRVGVRPLLMAGPLLAGVGFIWLSRLSVDGSYWTSLLPPMLLVSAGMGLMFVPLTLMVVSHVAPHETGAASGVLNTGQQIGGAIGLAAIGTIAWTSVAHSVTSQMAAAAAAGGTAAAAPRRAASAVPACRRPSSTTRSPSASRPACSSPPASSCPASSSRWSPPGRRVASPQLGRV